MSMEQIVSPDDFKRALSSWASGVSVVTTNAGGLLYGLTVSSFTSVSLDPPLVLVCITNQNRMVELVRQSQRFAVSLLRDDQRDASVYFSTPGREPTEGFVTIEGAFSALDQPIVKGALAHVVCQVHALVEGGDHTVVIGRVVHAETDEHAWPLLYFRRDYRALLP